MKKTVKIETNINGNQVTLETTLNITQEEINALFKKKEIDFLKSINAPQSISEEQQREEQEDNFEYEEFHNDNEPSYTPYSSVSSETTTETKTDSETQVASSSYTPYATARNSFPKSYVPKINGDYAPYSTYRVNMPQGWKPKE